ncbi:hypothetical protein C3B44_09065 [Corynebacterium yudongzhengii]|nr:hypothetical protein C3B44_09065 [Corynebacterium yudongzhengii]
MPRGADLVKPNAAELEEATGISELSDAAQALLDDGAKKVLVSRGAEGLVLVTAEDVTQAVLDEELEGNPPALGMR